ncbi:MAG: phosphate signaling complex protein PhoU [Ignavibacterium sp.]
MDRHFDQQLEKLKIKLIKMCSLVDEQIEFIIKVLEEDNLELAHLVIERDEKVDKFDLKIDKICQRIFALNQPVAMDLRLIMSALTINTNLERIGDIAVNIAENFIQLGHRPDFYSQTKLSEMNLFVKEMIKNSIDSFIESNPKLAEKVIQTDDVLDKLNIENTNILIDIMKEDKNNIESAIHLFEISRQLERLGDHSTNIAEEVYFIVESQMIKHNYEKYLFQDEPEEGDDD